MTSAPDGLLEHLTSRGVHGVTIAWIDNNGITRSRTVPTAHLAGALSRGVGITSLFAVFDSHDGITYAHEGLATPSGDVRLVPVFDETAPITPLSGQPGLAWVAGRQVLNDGTISPYDQRAVLERQVAAAAEAGFEIRAGFEVEMTLSVAPPGDRPGAGGAFAPAHQGPAYGPKALLDVHEFVVQLLADLAANEIGVGQFHAEYGGAQVELALDASGPVALADTQMLVRQTIHAAARAHGLRASLAPLTTTDGAGNGWHLHTSLTRGGANALTGDDEHGLSDVGRSYIGGLLRDLPGVVAVTAPSTGSLLRRRPGYFAGAYQVWGVQNREAPLRLIPATDFLGSEHTNIELKACDASANPYLALAVTIAAGLRGVRDGVDLPEPVQEDAGSWTEERRAAAGIAPLATTYDEQRADLMASDLVRVTLGEELFGAFVACRDADASWAADHTVEEIVESLRWLY